MYEPLHTGLTKRAAIAGTPEREARRRKWRIGIARLELADIAAAFRSGGVATPEIVWEPSTRDCIGAINDFLVAHWCELSPTGRVPPVASIDPLFFKVALGYVHLLEPLEAGADFRFRVFGSLVSSVSGFDMTGHLMTEFDASDYVVDFAIAASAAVVDCRKPLLIRRTPAGAAQTNIWERLTLPFADEGGAVRRLLIGSLPLRADGEVIRPTY